MRRPTRYLPALVLGLFGASVLFGCDLLKDKAADAGEDGAVVATTPAITDTTTPANTAAPTAPTPAPPLNPTTTPTAQPTVKTDGGAVADSGAKADGAAPVPPPFPAFDASALQTFDAGGLFKVPDGGFKPPWPTPK